MIAGYPDTLFLYNRKGKMETREESIVVGDVEYVRKDSLLTAAAQPATDTPYITRVCEHEPGHAKIKALVEQMMATPASESAAGDLPYSTELSDKRVERFMEEFGYPDSTTLFSMLKQYENQIRHEIAEAMRDNGHLNTKEQK